MFGIGWFPVEGWSFPPRFIEPFDVVFIFLMKLLASHIKSMWSSRLGFGINDNPLDNTYNSYFDDYHARKVHAILWYMLWVR